MISVTRKITVLESHNMKKIARENFWSKTVLGVEIKYWLIAIALSPLAIYLRDLAIS